MRAAAPMAIRMPCNAVNHHSIRIEASVLPASPAERQPEERGLSNEEGTDSLCRLDLATVPFFSYLKVDTLGSRWTGVPLDGHGGKDTSGGVIV